MSSHESISGGLAKETPFMEEEIAIENADPEKIGTTIDHRDMVRMGKTQQFKVRLCQRRSSNDADVSSAIFDFFQSWDLLVFY
jgi:hypothetical protein